MDKPWEALSKALVDAVIESLKVDWATCVDFGFWVWNFVSHHWLWLSFRIGSRLLLWNAFTLVVSRPCLVSFSVDSAIFHAFARYSVVLGSHI